VTEGFCTPLSDALIFTKTALYNPLGRLVKRDVSIPLNLSLTNTTYIYVIKRYYAPVHPLVPPHTLRNFFFRKLILK
jgi:hypothetical protein